MSPIMWSQPRPDQLSIAMNSLSIDPQNNRKPDGESKTNTVFAALRGTTPPAGCAKAFDLTKVHCDTPLPSIEVPPAAPRSRSIDQPSSLAGKMTDQKRKSAPPPSSGKRLQLRDIRSFGPLKARERASAAGLPAHHPSKITKSKRNRAFLAGSAYRPLASRPFKLADLGLPQAKDRVQSLPMTPMNPSDTEMTNG